MLHWRGRKINRCSTRTRQQGNSARLSFQPIGCCRAVLAPSFCCCFISSFLLAADTHTLLPAVESSHTQTSAISQNPVFEAVHTSQTHNAMEDPWSGGWIERCIEEQALAKKRPVAKSVEDYYRRVGVGSIAKRQKTGQHDPSQTLREITKFATEVRLAPSALT